jgi:hypothetical protein
MALTFQPSMKPYQEDSTNAIYDLLFCDSIDHYKKMVKQPYAYPWNILLSDTVDAAGLEKITTDRNVETRVKMLAYDQLRSNGEPINKRDLLAVIIEVGLDDGLDVLASYQDGTARYLNHAGSVLIWEATDAQSHQLTDNLFNNSIAIVSKIGPWNNPRRPHPATGNVRLSFIVSDGLYFGEGPINVLFNDALAKPALNSATELMQYLTEKAITKNK